MVLGGASLTGIVWSIATGPRAAGPEVVSRPRAEPAAMRSDGRIERDWDLAQPMPAATSSGPRPVRIDLNTATRAELEALPGVGPELATRIMEFREQRGPFKNVEQLDNVKGIGPKLMERIRPMVKVGSG